LDNSEFVKSQAKARTALEKASKITKRRSLYKPQNDRPQFVDKVSDLLFRPAGPTRSKSLRQQPQPRPASTVTNSNHEREASSTALIIVSPSNNSLLSPINSISQDTTLASTRPEAMVQFIQSEPIDLSTELQDSAFTEELDNFEKAFHFGSKYHFMNNAAAQSRMLADSPILEPDDSSSREQDSFEYMQSWDVYCLGDLFKQIYLAEDIPNNSIVMALRPHISIADLTESRLVRFFRYSKYLNM
jgi:hypothetical protein